MLTVGKVPSARLFYTQARVSLRLSMCQCIVLPVWEAIPPVITPRYLVFRTLV
jgi:hypothetical protein